MNTRTIRGMTWGVLALTGFLGASATQAQVRPRPQYKSQPIQAQVWIDEPVYAVGEEVRFTVTVDRPAFVAVFRVDAAGRRYRLTAEPGGVWVTPHRPLRAPGSNVYALLASDPCESGRIVVVARDRAFRSASEYFAFARAINGYHGSCNVASCGFDIVRRSIHHRPSGFYLGFFLGGLDFEIASRARVYVDGIFIGIGPTVLSRVTPGRHRLTVVDPRGHKYARQVKVPRRWSARAECRHPGCSEAGDRSYKKERR